MPVGSLPQPEHWRDKPGMLLSSVVMMVGGAILTGAWMVIALSRNEYLTAIVGGGITAFLIGFLLVLLLAYAGLVTVRGEYDATSTTLRACRRIDQLSLAWILAAFVASAVFALYAPSGGIDLDLTDGQRIFYPIGAALAAIIAFLTLRLRLAAGSVSRVRLTVDEIEIAEQISGSVCRWDDIVDVTDKKPEGRTAARYPIVLVLGDGRTKMVTNPEYHTPHGRALYWMFRHYWQHPEDRREFTDGRALQRLRNEQFDPT